MPSLMGIDRPLNSNDEGIKKGCIEAETIKEVKIKHGGNGALTFV